MLAAIFVASGTDAVINPDRLAPRAKPVTDHIAPLLERANAHLPTETAALVRVNGAVQVAGGLLLLTRLRRPAAVALAASLVPTTIAGHPFWQFDDPAERAQQRVHFLKNLGLLGGLILAAADTGGKPGLAWRAGHLAHYANRSVRRAARNTKAKTRIARKAAAMGRHLPN